MTTEFEKKIVQIALEEIAATAGLKPIDRGARILKPFLNFPLRKFSHLLAEIDERVGQGGLQPGTSWALPHLTNGATNSGVENIPREGPVLIISNHPGGTEILAIPSAVPRPDSYIVTNPLNFLRALPNTRYYCLFATENHPMEAIRNAARLLREGHLVILFPQGLLEPDPALIPGAELGLKTWSSSIGGLLKAVPNLRIVPTAMSGVLNPDAFNHWLLRSFKTQFLRQKMANYFQVIMTVMQKNRFPITPHVSFGTSFTIQDLDCSHDSDVHVITARAIERVKPLLAAVAAIHRLQPGLPLDYRWM